MQRRRTTTSAIVELLRRGDSDAETMMFITGEPFNRVSAALYWLTTCGAVRLTRAGRYRLTPGRDQRVRVVEWIADPITRNRSGVPA